MKDPFTPEGELWILAANGMAYWPEDPNPEVIDEKVIAQALAQKVRFGGHGRPFYSVAQHGVLVSQLVHTEGEAMVEKGLMAPYFVFAAARHALMHDAHEAWLVDLPSPLKRLPWLYDKWKKMENKWDEVIFDVLGIQDTPQIQNFVKQMDLVAMRIEGYTIMPEPPNDWEWPGHGASAPHIIELTEKYAGILPASPVNRVWGWEEAEQRFLEEWRGP